MDLSEREAWIALAAAPGIGPEAFADLRAAFGSPAAVLASSPARLREQGLTQTTIDALSDPAPVRAAREWLAVEGHTVLTLEDPDYPGLLQDIPSPPPVLYVNGDPAVLARPQLAMVGSRHPTAGGLDNARAFAHHLSTMGLAVTSGLALGVDGAAHEACLEGGSPTLAVLGTGVDRIYPARHQPLARRIVEAGGALVSEFPLGTRARRSHFPRRNRVISGLALGTLIVEASTKSGSLITARMALEQGREVFAIPGSIHNPLARGCHSMIKQGAKLVESAGDIIEELGAFRGQGASLAAPEHPSEAAGPAIRDPDHRALLNHMGFDPVTVDSLVERSGLTVETVSSMLLIMELDGLITSIGGGLYARRESSE